jgi:ketosteroid isomerase-like protein
MSRLSEDVISGLYAAFGRGDLPAVLAMVDQDIDWHTPENLPHGGDFRGREAVGGFFRGIGERWESLAVELEALVSGGDRVIALARAHGRLRGTGEEFEYSAAHAWTLRGETPVRFDEYVNAPVSLPAAHAVAR